MACHSSSASAPQALPNTAIFFTGEVASAVLSCSSILPLWSAAAGAGAASSSFTSGAVGFGCSFVSTGAAGFSSGFVSSGFFSWTG